MYSFVLYVRLLTRAPTPNTCFIMFQVFPEEFAVLLLLNACFSNEAGPIITKGSTAGSAPLGATGEHRQTVFLTLLSFECHSSHRAR